MAKREVLRWITVNGAHVPIYADKPANDYGDFSVVGDRYKDNRNGIEFSTYSELLEYRQDDTPHSWNTPEMRKMQSRVNVIQEERKRILQQLNQNLDPRTKSYYTLQLKKLKEEEHKLLSRMGKVRK